MPFRAEGEAAGSRGCARRARAPARRRSQGGSREKTVVRWSGATSRQRQRFERETQERRRRAGREPTSQNVGSGRGATAPRTLRTRDSPEGGRGIAAGLKAKRRAHQWQSHDARRNSGAVAKALRQLVRPLTGGAPAERPASWAPCREHGTAG